MCVDGTQAYSFWQRYLQAFERVIVVARCDDDVRVEGTPVEGPGVSLWPLTNGRGLRGALVHAAS
jgi:hypothetical protein